MLNINPNTIGQASRVNPAQNLGLSDLNAVLGHYRLDETSRGCGKTGVGCVIEGILDPSGVGIPELNTEARGSG